jgi:hypothetical protein
VLDVVPVDTGAEIVPAGVPPDVAEVVALEPVNVGALTVPAGVYEPPPATPGSMPAADPLTNLPRRSGVPFVPSQRCQPPGIADSDPDHMTITPTGTPS